MNRAGGWRVERLRRRNRWGGSLAEQNSLTTAARLLCTPARPLRRGEEQPSQTRRQPAAEEGREGGGRGGWKVPKFFYVLNDKDIKSWTKGNVLWTYLTDSTATLLNQSNGEANPPPQEDEEEQDSSEEASKEDCEEQPGVS